MLHTVVLMDLTIPETDRIELMRDITRTVDVPVIFVSAYSQDEHVTRAFDMGASDYIVKPFLPSELAARTRAALRKGTSGRTGPAELFVPGDLAVRYAQCRVTVAGQPMESTPIEFRLLFEVSVNAGRVVSHYELFRCIWGPARSGEAHSLRSFVRKLRNKLGDDATTRRTPGTSSPTPAWATACPTPGRLAPDESLQHGRDGRPAISAGRGRFR